ncbi:MAG: hypothetical protein ACXQTL_05940 [Methanosarcinales archaeon]
MTEAYVSETSMNLLGKVHYIDFILYNLGETTLTGIAATINALCPHLQCEPCNTEVIKQ